ncbi:MAG: tryptophan-rich sensory protein [Chitinophagales bacterium]|jgi:benzodiazapine receptor|nr:tryptophan-rich sensory protein [Chitinophagales bacterium]
MWLALIIFALINFAALGIGALLMGNPRTNTWYQNAKKAPWTPPNWVFGAAWTVIMICYTIFLWLAARQYSMEELKPFYIMYGLQWVLNVVWNPVFFRWHKTAQGFAIILALSVVVGWFVVWGFIHLGVVAVLVVPYFVWLLIASSLNGYVLAKN